MSALSSAVIPARSAALEATRADCVWNRLPFRAYTSANMAQGLDAASSEPKDETLMKQIAQGDRAAFALLYRRFSTPLYSLACKMLLNEAEAKDLLQEVFLTVWNKASTFREEKGSAFAWVVSQTRNRAIDRIRSRRRRGELVEAHRPELEPSGSVVASSAENTERSERGRLVRSALNDLTEEQRLVLRLAYFEGLTQVEIAERLAEPLGTIKARAHRGLARLRTSLRFLHD